MTRSVGYCLYPLVEGSTVSNSVKCNFDGLSYFVFAKRRSIIFMVLNDEGPKPVKTLMFSKLITSMRVVSEKGLRRKGDLLVVVFADKSFWVFDGMSHVKFKYQSKSSDLFEKTICLVHPILPIMMMQNKIGLLCYWDARERENKVFDLRVEDLEIVDIRFLPYSSPIVVIILYQLPKNEMSVVAYRFDEKFLVLEKQAPLTIRKCVDPTAQFLIPLPQRADEHPDYILVGSEIAEVRSKQRSANILTPFDERRPTCYCEISPLCFLIADSGGYLYTLNVEGGILFSKVGMVDTVPESLTHVDGSIFFVGSAHGNAMFIRFDCSTVSVLNVIDQHIPVNSFSKFCADTGSVYLTQGTSERARLSSLRTGHVFSCHTEIECKGVVRVFGVKSGFLVMNTVDQQSLCLSLDQGTLVTPHGFCSDEETVGVIDCDSAMFIQVTRHNIFSAGGGVHRAFETGMLACGTSNGMLSILFSDKVKFLSYNLEDAFDIPLGRGDALAYATYNDYAAVVFMSGDVFLYHFMELVREVSVESDSVCLSLSFLESSAGLMLVLALVDGLVIRYLVPDMSELSRREYGYLTCGMTALDETSLFVSASSAFVLYSDGNYVSVLCPKHLACSVMRDDLVLVTPDRVMIGTLASSNAATIQQYDCIAQPLLFSVHQEPLSLFASIQQNGFLLCGFYLPGMEPAYTQTMDEDEEITSLLYDSTYGITFCGACSRSGGRLFAVGCVFNEFKALKVIDIPGGIFCMSRYEHGRIIVGGHCQLFLVEEQVSLSGILDLSILQVLPINQIPRSLCSVGDIIVVFGVSRAISFLKVNASGQFDVISEEIIPGRLHSGFAGLPLSLLECHLFTTGIINQYFSQEISVWDLKVNNTSLKRVSLKKVSTMLLESPVSSFSLVKPGFALLATRDGGLYCLMEYDKSQIRVMLSLLQQMSTVAKIDIQDTKIVDGNLLLLYKYLPIDVQQRIAHNLKSTNTKLLELIQSLSHNISQLCSSFTS